MKALTVVFLVGTIVLMIASLAYAVGGMTILISEVEYDTNISGAEYKYEWFELYNTTDSPYTISGWTVEDGPSGSSDTIPDITIPAVGIDGQPGGTIVVAGDKTKFLDYYLTYYGQSFPRPDLVVDVGGTIGNGLANTGDHLILKNNVGTEIDAVSWGSDTTVFDCSGFDCSGVDAGHSLARTIRPSPDNPFDSDDAGDWHDENPKNNTQNET